MKERRPDVLAAGKDEVDTLERRLALESIGGVVDLLRRESLEIDLKRSHKLAQSCAAVLMEAVIFSTLLRNRAKAKEAASQALLLACPPSLLKCLQERMEAEGRFPSPSSIQRAAFMVDCAAMLVHQATFVGIMLWRTPHHGAGSIG